MLISQLVNRASAPILRGVDVEDVDAWFDRRLPELQRVVVSGYQASKVAAHTYVADHASAEGVAIRAEDVEPDLARIIASLTVTAPVAFKSKMAATGSPEAATRVMRTKASGAIKRLALQGARSTLLATFDTEQRVVGYRRVTAANACAFCVMLAGRGTVYRSGGSAFTVGAPGSRVSGSRQVGESYHDSCRCTIEPEYG